jgi:hypothetical protein
LVREYVDVLLEAGMMGTVVEDPEALIAGILSVVVGPHVLAPVVVIKAKYDSVDDLANRIEAWLDRIK